MLLVLLAAGAGFAPAAAQAPPSRADADEAFVLLRHPPFVRAIVPALHVDGRFFLPLAGVLGHLQLEATYDANRGVVYGHYMDRARPFVASAPLGVATFDGRRIPLGSSDVIRDDDDLFVVPELFHRLFGWKLNLDPASLDVMVATADTLPAARRQLRGALRSARPPGGTMEHAPLRFDRERQRARIGHARYAAAMEASEALRFATASVALAGEIAGGDFHVTLDGTTATGAPAVLAAGGRWQYVIHPGGALLTQLRAGDLVAAGLNSTSFRGVQWTNAPAEPRTVAGAFPLRGATGPAWEIELYADDRLIAFTTADAAGEYEFTVPLTYGAALLELRFYSPAGAVVVQRRRLPLPAVFLPAGTTEYTAGLGMAADGGTRIGQLRLEHGVSRHVTAFGGYELRGPSAGVPLRAPYLGVSARARSTAFGSAEWVSGELVRLSGYALLPSNASAAVVATDFRRASVLNPRGAGRSVALQAAVPFRVAGVPAHTRGAWEHASLLAEGSSQRRELGLGFSAHGLNPALTYRQTLHEAGAGGYRTSKLLLSAQQIVRRTLAGASAVIDAESGRLRSWQAEAARLLPGQNRLALLVRHERVLGTSVQLRFQYSGRAAHAASAIRHAHSAVTVTQNVRGSVGYDPGRGAFEYSGLDWTGRSAVVFHTFVDYNGNGVPDEGEPRIAVDVLRFREAVPTRLTDDGVVVATNLQPYRRYSVDVVEARSPNPFFVPRDSAFSFVTDPNGFKQIFVPFLVTGVLEGRLHVEVPGGRTAGVPVHIRAADGRLVAEEMTYSDGSFYRLGLLPGDYTIGIAEPYLELTGWTAEPAAFSVRALPEGDTVNGVVIVARPR
jgi:hypothetical protein